MTAKVDFRLVPDQEPEDVLIALRSHLDAEGFPDVKMNIWVVKLPHARILIILSSGWYVILLWKFMESR